MMYYTHEVVWWSCRYDSIHAYWSHHLHLGAFPGRCPACRCLQYGNKANHIAVAQLRIYKNKKH